MQKYEIDKLLKKVNQIGDCELIYYVRKLIHERDYLTELANKDDLTGLKNRRALSDIKSYSAVAMCDIDDYKYVNDIYGHPIGDVIIKNVGQILQNSVGEKDSVYRYGGDEFLIVFHDCPEHIVCDRLETIRKIVESRLMLSNGEKITLSFGLVINDGKTLGDSIEKADIALYQSKEQGKNQITKYKSLKR